MLFDTYRIQFCLKAKKGKTMPEYFKRQKYHLFENVYACITEKNTQKSKACVVVLIWIRNKVVWSRIHSSLSRIVCLELWNGTHYQENWRWQVQGNMNTNSLSAVTKSTPHTHGHRRKLCRGRRWKWIPALLVVLGSGEMLTCIHDLQANWFSYQA